MLYLTLIGNFPGHELDRITGQFQNFGAHKSIFGKSNTVRLNFGKSNTVRLMTRKTEISEKFWMSFPGFAYKGS